MSIFSRIKIKKALEEKKISEIRYKNYVEVVNMIKNGKR